MTKISLGKPFFRKTLVVTASIALITFFLSERYHNSIGLFSNLMNEHFGICLQYDENDCVFKYPYKWILAILTALVGLVGYLTSNQEPKE